MKKFCKGTLFVLVIISTPPHALAEKYTEKINQVTEAPTLATIPATIKANDSVSKAFIDPVKGIYGLRFGSTIDETYKYFGKPSGVFQISESRVMLMYGKSHTLIFRKGKLFCVMVTDCQLHWELGNMMEEHPFFDRGWILEPGITSRTSKKRVKEILGRDIPDNTYQWSYDKGDATIELNFTSIGTENMKSFEVIGFKIEYYGEQGK